MHTSESLLQPHHDRRQRSSGTIVIGEKSPACEMRDWRNLRQGRLCQVSGVISGTPYVQKLSDRERYHPSYYQYHLVFFIGRS